MCMLGVHGYIHRKGRECDATDALTSEVEMHSAVSSVLGWLCRASLSECLLLLIECDLGISMCATCFYPEVRYSFCKTERRGSSKDVAADIGNTTNRERVLFLAPRIKHVAPPPPSPLGTPSLPRTQVETRDVFPSESV